MTWAQFKDLFTTRFVSAETVAATLINLNNEKPKEHEAYGAYASRLITTLMSRWKQIDVEQIAVSVVMAHLAQLDPKLQRLAFTTEIATRQQLQQEMQAFVYLKRKSNDSTNGTENPKRFKPTLTPIKCYNCGKTGHKQSECRLKGKAIPKKTSTSTGPVRTTSQPQPVKNNSVVCYKCNATGHIASRCTATGGAQASAPAAARTEHRVDMCAVESPSGTLKHQAEQISRLRASQSPIAISLQKCPTWTSLDALKFRGYWDNDGRGILLNTGQTAFFTLDSKSRPRLSGGPLIGEYIFEQMHFHWSVDDFTGCEHVLDGHGYAAECHFVHYNSKYESMEAAVGHADGLAVVGFLLEAVDAPNPRFDKLVEGLERIQKRDETVQVTAESLSWMERDDLREGSYVTYKGSLTTPPFTECVTWIIYEKPVQIGSEQLGLLRQLEGLDSKPIDRNVRPTQRHPPGHSVIYVKQVQSKL